MKKTIITKLIMIFLVIVAAVSFVAGGIVIGASLKSDEIGGDSKTRDTSEVSDLPLDAGEDKEQPNPVEVVAEYLKNEEVDEVGNYLSGEVMVLLYASECCGPMNDKTEVIEFIKNQLSQSENWIVNPMDEEYMNIRANADILMIADSGAGLVFLFDENGKINSISSYYDYRLMEGY